MKNKLIFRIFGALASALIIVALFVPFISVNGYTVSLWDAYSQDSIYLPIMILAFGAIGVLFFSLNIKTEFAYSSVGAITFFIVMRTVDIVNQGTFSTLGIGYYLLVIGTLLTAVMAFLTNLKGKQYVSESLENKQPINQINNNFENMQLNSDRISPVQPIENLIQPLPAETNPLQNNQLDSMPVPDLKPLNNEIVSQNINSNINPISNVNITPISPVIEPVKPVEVQQNAVPEISFENSIQPQPITDVNVNQVNTNIALNDFSKPVNPVLQEFSTPMQQSQILPQQNISSSQPVNNQNMPQPSNIQNNNQSVEVDIFGQQINNQ